MARIALAIGGAIVGALLAPFTGGLINPYTGAEIGFTLGGVAGGLLFPGKLPPGPRLNDLIVSTATDGAPIPFGYGQARVAGNVIWAPPIIETSQTKSVKGGPKQTTYTYTSDVAVSFGEGPGTVGRIWFDSKIVYDPAGTTQPITGISQLATSITVQCTLNPPTGTQVTLANVGSGYDGNYQCIETGPTAFILFSATTGLPTLGAGGTASFPAPTYPAPVIYNGTETQGADPTVQAGMGASITPAFRGLIVCVWTNFPLNDFGNRVPNIRAEITYELFSLPSTGFGPFDLSFSMSGISPPTDTHFGPVTPSSPGDLALCVTQFGGSALTGDGFVQLDVGGQVHSGGGGFFLGSLPTAAELNLTSPGPGNGNSIAVAMGLWASNGTPLVGTITNISVANNVATVTVPNGFVAGTYVKFFNTFMTGVNLNCISSAGYPQYLITSANGTSFTFNVTAPNQSTAQGTGAQAQWQMYRQFSQNYISYPTTVMSVTLQNVQQGSLIVVGFASGGSFGSSKPTIASVNDGVNTYQEIDSPGQSTVIGVSLVYAVNKQNGGNLTITVNVANQASGSTDSLNFYEFLGGGSNGSPVPSTTMPLIVGDICERTGLLASQLNMSGIADLPVPDGYVVTRPSTAQSILAPLCSAYFFDAVETGGQIAFVPRGLSPSSLSIPEADLGMYKDNLKLSEQLGQIQDLPADVQVLFNDKALDYQQNHTRKIRHRRVVKTRNETVMELPLTIDSTTARQIAEKALFLAYLERHPYDINLWRAQYLLYDPTDVVNFTYEGLAFTMRITKSTLGADFTCQVSGVNENSSNYQSTVAGSSGVGVTPGSGKTLPNSQLFMFDIPLLRDSDSNPAGSGYYWGLTSLDVKDWPGGALEQSSDQTSWTQVGTSSVGLSYGYATTTLGAPRSPWSWDTKNSLTVFMLSGTLAGESDFNVLNGANALLVGSEVVQFSNAVQNPDGSYTLSRLLRGRRGSELSCGTHGQAEAVVLLNAPGMVRQTASSSDLQVLRFYEGISYGQVPGTVSNRAFTNSANDLRPYAVTSVAGSRDSSQNLSVSWIRRTRIGGDWLEGIGTVPLSETVESYDVDVLNGNGGVVRTFAALSSPALVYTAAQQTADFGYPLSAVTLNIYQNSSLIGRGFAKTAVV